MDSLSAHPAGYSDADTAHQLIAAYCAVIEFFRSLLEHSADKTGTTEERSTDHMNWDECYQKAETRWDKDALAPAMTQYLTRHAVHGRVLVPGS